MVHSDVHNNSMVLKHLQRLVFSNSIKWYYYKYLFNSQQFPFYTLKYNYDVNKQVGI